MRNCKNCGKKFEPQYNKVQQVCSFECSIELAKNKIKKKQSKDWNKEKSKRKEALKTNADYVRELQKIFNTYIRERDKNKPCISCNKVLSGKFDAGHYYSVGSYPELRFHEDNVHGQCVHCNQHKRGNLIDYLECLHTRIGLVKILKLKELANVPRKYTIEELKGLKVFYKLKIKNLKDRL